MKSVLLLVTLILCGCREDNKQVNTYKRTAEASFRLGVACGDRVNLIKRLNHEPELSGMELTTAALSVEASICNSNNCYFHSKP